MERIKLNSIYKEPWSLTLIKEKDLKEKAVILKDLIGKDGHIEVLAQNYISKEILLRIKEIDDEKVFLVNLENPIKTFRTFDTLQCWVESVMIPESEIFLAKRHFFKISYEFHRRKEQTILFGQTTKLINLGDILVDDSNNNEEYKVKGIGSLTNKNDGLYCSIIIDTSNNNEKNFVGRELIIKI